jgi:hypothetical protein
MTHAGQLAMPRRLAGDPVPSEDFSDLALSILSCADRPASFHAQDTRFNSGLGELVGDDVCDGTPVGLRIRWSDITPTSARMEQAFSADGGETLEINLRMGFNKPSSS